MNKLVITPIILAISLVTSSCGSSPKAKQESPVTPVIKRPMYPATNDFSEQPVGFNQTAIPVNSAIQVATRVAGRPGFVFNPYNQNMVEVNGMLSGTKVRDPMDADPSHIFIVP